jgi:hypothetical protein
MFSDTINAVSSLSINKINFSMIFNSQDELGKLFMDTNPERPFSHMAKVIFISSQLLTAKHAAKFFTAYSILNFVTIVSHNDKIFIGIQKSKSDLFKMTSDATKQQLFNDKLSDLNGYNYRVMIFDTGMDIRMSENHQLRGLYLPFLDILMQKQKTKVKFTICTSNSVHECIKSIYQLIIRSQVDLILSTQMNLNFPTKKLYLSEETAHCVLIPKSPPISLTQMVLIEPFDVTTWICLIITIITILVVWRLFKNYGARDTPENILFQHFAQFVGQGVNFHPENRRILVIMTQITIFMLFVLSNSYSGCMTSFMVEKLADTMEIKTFNELFDSNRKIFVSGIFHRKASNDLKYEKALESGRIEVMQVKYFLSDLMHENYSKVAIEFECDFAKKVLKFMPTHYLLPDKIFVHYKALEGGILNPFIDRMQKYMDLSYEAGLNEHWQVLFSEYESEFRIKDVGKASNNEMLTFDDISPLFMILPIGFSIALIVLLIEVIYHKRTRDLRWKQSLKLVHPGVVIEKWRKSKKMRLNKEKLRIYKMTKYRIKYKRLQRCKLIKRKIHFWLHICANSR